MDVDLPPSPNYDPVTARIGYGIDTDDDSDVDEFDSLQFVVDNVLNRCSTTAVPTNVECDVSEDWRIFDENRMYDQQRRLARTLMRQSVATIIGRYSSNIKAVEKRALDALAQIGEGKLTQIAMRARTLCEHAQRTQVAHVDLIDAMEWASQTRSTKTTPFDSKHSVRQLLSYIRNEIQQGQRFNVQQPTKHLNRKRQRKQTELNSDGEAFFIKTINETDPSERFGTGPKYLPPKPPLHTYVDTKLRVIPALSSEEARQRELHEARQVSKALINLKKRLFTAKQTNEIITLFGGPQRRDTETFLPPLPQHNATHSALILGAYGCLKRILDEQQDVVDCIYSRRPRDLDDAKEADMTPAQWRTSASFNRSKQVEVQEPIADRAKTNQDDDRRREQSLQAALATIEHVDRHSHIPVPEMRQHILIDVGKDNRPTIRETTYQQTKSKETNDSINLFSSDTDYDDASD